MSNDSINLEVRSRIDQNGQLRIWLEPQAMPAPGPDEILVRVEAAPLNPSDQILLLGPVDPASLRASLVDGRPVIEGQVPPERLGAIAGRLGRALAVGNEGAGTVVAAGSNAKQFIGRQVAIRAATGTYAQYQAVRAADALPLPDGVPVRAGAAAFINPLTALGMVETMRREGHTALVHTAAASSVGTMLNRLCLADGIPLVNIVRSQDQVQRMRAQGATHVLDSSAPDFREALVAALRETGATLAFDAIGGGKMAGQILAAMETVASERLSTYSRYGAPTHKQVYIYGVLDTGPRILEGQLGTAWGVGGWLMTWFYESLPPADAARLRARAAAELGTIFASDFSAEIGLADLLTLDAIQAFTRKASGAKFLVSPHKAPA